MSWDIFVQDVPVDAKKIADIPDDFKPAPIGKHSDVIQKIREIVPFADFTDPEWGYIDGEGFSIEVNIPDDDDLLMGFAFHVRGGVTAVGIIADILDQLGLRAIDGGSDTGFFDRDKAQASLLRWRTYRDQVINAPRSDDQS